MKNKKTGGYQIFFWAIKNSKSSFSMIMLMAVLVSICELSIPWLLEKVIDEATRDTVDVDKLNQFGFAMLAVIVGIYLTHHFYIRAEVKLMCELSYGLYKRMYGHLISQPLSYFKRKKSGELMHRITNDTNEFENHSKAILSDMPYDVMVIIGVIAMMLYLDATLSIIVVTFLIVTSIISAKIGRPLPTLERRVQMLGARFSNRLQEILHGIKTVKTFGTDDSETDLLDEANTRRVEVMRSSGAVESYLMPIFDLMEILGVVVVVWYGAHLILDDSLSVGGLVAFIAYMEILAGPVSRGGKYYRHWREAIAVAQRISEYLNDSDKQPEVFEGNPHTVKRDEIHSVIFDQVSFKYPKSQQLALNKIDLEVRKGEIVALVGRNGAGKSTTMELLQRFYSPDQGRILVGGVDLRAWEQKAWRHNIGVMSQDVFLFNSSIRDNIRYGRTDATNEQIANAVDSASVNTVIDKLPKGLDSIVGEKGGKLSGGERQRIALARLFLSDPAVIIYDEPTAAMDGEAAKDIARTILKLAHNRISFVIAHQAEMIAIADRVILFDDGQIVDAGTHKQLIKTNALYRMLFESIEHKKNYDDISREFYKDRDSVELVGM